MFECMRDSKPDVRSLSLVDAESSSGIANNGQQFPEGYHPRMFYRGSSQSFAWIPAKNMRE